MYLHSWKIEQKSFILFFLLMLSPWDQYSHLVVRYVIYKGSRLNLSPSRQNYCMAMYTAPPMTTANIAKRVWHSLSESDLGVQPLRQNSTQLMIRFALLESND